jgi:hypothetical protein
VTFNETKWALLNFQRLVLRAQPVSSANFIAVFRQQSFCLVSVLALHTRGEVPAHGDGQNWICHASSISRVIEKSIRVP